MLFMVFVTRGLHSHISQNFQVKEVINFLLYIDEAGEGYETAAYTKPYSFFDSCYDAGECLYS